MIYIPPQPKFANPSLKLWHCEVGVSNISTTSLLRYAPKLRGASATSLFTIAKLQIVKQLLFLLL